MSAFDRLNSLYNETLNKNEKVLDRYFDGNSSIPEVIFQTTGNAAGLLGGVVGMPIAAGLEATGLDQPIAAGMQYIADSPVGEYAQEVAAEYPRTAANLSALGNIAGAGLGGGAAKGAVRTAASSIPTKLKDFYKSPLHALTSTAVATTAAVPSMIKDAFTPTGSATKRQSGLSSRRRQEIATEDQTFAEGSAYAGDLINRQLQGRKESTQGAPIIENSPYGLAQRGRGTLERNPEELKSLTFNKKIPESVQDRHWNDMVVSQNVKKTKGETEIIVKDPKIAGLGQEALGLKSTSSHVTRYFNENRQKSYLKRLNEIARSSHKQLPPKFMLELAQMGKAFDMAKIGDRKARRLPMLVERMGSSWKNSKGLKEAPSASTIKQTIMDARLKQHFGKPLTEKEAFFLDKWNKSKIGVGTVKDANGKVVSSSSIKDLPDDVGEFTLATNYNSGDKSLGGVRNTITIDPTTQTMYSTVSDGSDLFGMLPPSSKLAVTVVPTQSLRFSPRVRKRYELERKTPDFKASEEAAAGRLEQFSGVPRQAGERPIPYSNRAIGEYKATPEAQDYLDVARRSGMLTGAAVPIVSGSSQTEQQ